MYDKPITIQETQPTRELLTVDCRHYELSTVDITNNEPAAADLQAAGGGLFTNGAKILLHVL